ncbi:MAG: alpha-glucosidase [Clostridium sp.]|nr:alpha-glucosidase [Clostridium sp.]
MERQWWKEAVVYQIYPRSFQDSNGDGIGDLAGITSRLDYLKYLGIDVLWVSPFFKSPNDDNGYDISDYREIMTEFGSMEDFKTLIGEIHARDMKLVMDLVVNHSSDEHAWFQESKKSRDNEKSDYYIWKDPKADGSPPNDWTSIFSGPAWEYVKERDQYYLHLFSKKQPDLNWENEALRQEVYEIMKFWINQGVDGFRMDVINLISKKFYEEGQGEDIHFMGPRVHEFLQEMYQEVLAGEDLLTVGECPGATVDDAIDFTAPERKELHMIFTFEHMDLDGGKHGKWDFKDFSMPALRENLIHWQESLHGKGWNSLYLNNHDQPRMVSRFGDDETYRVQSAKMLANLVHFMEGTPYIYQGEELGMTNLDIESLEDLKDLESLNAWRDLVEEKKVFSKEHMMEAIRRKGRDNARSPMQWDDTKKAGFTSGTPWLKVNSNYPEINAADQVKNEDSVFHYYRKLISLRRELPVMVYGKTNLLFPDHKEIFAWERILGDERLIVVNNFTKNTVTVDLREAVEREEFTLYLSNYKDFKMSESGSYQLRAYESFVLFNESSELL